MISSPAIKNIKVEVTPKIMATMVDNKVTSAASIGLFPPIALATKACVPVAVAMRTACKKKNILWPVPTAAIASVPKEPTAFRATILTKANRMLFRIEAKQDPRQIKFLDWMENLPVLHFHFYLKNSNFILLSI